MRVAAARLSGVGPAGKAGASACSFAFQRAWLSAGRDISDKHDEKILSHVIVARHTATNQTAIEEKEHTETCLTRQATWL
jgi:hypothetical protein